MFFSIIIPLYNRPQEIKELLESLTQQTYTSFEVLVVEDGSKHDAKAIVEGFKNQLDIHYFYKENDGQGFARNYGFERAKGDYFVFFDSDCIIPHNYLELLKDHFYQEYLDAYGGPDEAHSSFTAVQKAISYGMTSFLTTGGIRSKQKNAGGKFHPRSFNMGISREVWEKTKGFKLTRMGEDMDLSIRIHQMGFKIALVPEAKVYHKRRTSFKQFWKQIHSFGRTRVDLFLRYPDTLKAVHLLPVAFTAFLVLVFILNLFSSILAILANLLLLVYIMLIFFDSLFRNKSLNVAFLSIIASFIQLTAYGFGFMQDYCKRVILKQDINNQY
jgi:glycosyltransferase involved in cell wall biosynthesis